MSENKEPTKREIRLVFQGSIPVPGAQEGEDLFEQLKNLVKTTDPRSTLNGQIVKMLEPCCGDKSKNQLSPGVVYYGPPGFRRL